MKTSYAPKNNNRIKLSNHLLFGPIQFESDNYLGIVTETNNYFDEITSLSNNNGLELGKEIKTPDTATWDHDLKINVQVDAPSIKTKNKITKYAGNVNEAKVLQRKR